ncbi:MAG: DNA-directed RNA polymerase subunit beta [Candidatus Coatesbacteria bacterium]|nr:DNA-directed RNA polymerase subunit beta [Candidatus Coatesbacteria bacterium]
MISANKPVDVRRTFVKKESAIEVPSLLAVQTESFDQFLQHETPPERRKKMGAQAVFEEVFPIENSSRNCELEFIAYEVGAEYVCPCGQTSDFFPRPEPCERCGHQLKRRLETRYTEEECLQREMNYAASMRVRLRLSVFDVSDEVRKPKSATERTIFLCEMPLMTPRGTFIINGTERTIVNQLHRSPGVFFARSKETGREDFSARIVPERGPWLEFLFDSSGVLQARIDTNKRKRRIPASSVLRALGLRTKEEVVQCFIGAEQIEMSPDGAFRSKLNRKMHLTYRPKEDVLDEKTGAVLVRKHHKISRAALARFEKGGVEYLPMSSQELLGREVVWDIHDEQDNVIVPKNKELTSEDLAAIQKAQIERFELYPSRSAEFANMLFKTIEAEKIEADADAEEEEQEQEAPTQSYLSSLVETTDDEAARKFFNNLFFNPKRYDLSEIGRLRFNFKFKKKTPLSERCLTREDIIDTIGYLFKLKAGEGEVDDIDHLGNRRIRRVGELLENQFRLGLMRLERLIREKINSQDIEELTPQELVNAKVVSGVIKEFFGGSQLSQFLEQTNPLAELTHKRRLSALGPGGLTRDRATFEVRDVHPTHYGRICPIETPEGPNIGLLASLTVYARVNERGFIETPYREIDKNGVVTSAVTFLDAHEEDKHHIAQASEPLTADGRLATARVGARFRGNFHTDSSAKIRYLDASPSQIVSMSAALIPFLEHDDANRALMGSNMQRQAVPLMRPSPPLVGTGMEMIAARDSGVVQRSKRDGTVVSVVANRVVIEADDERIFDEDGNRLSEGKFDIYYLKKFLKSNQNTCINERPSVRVGQRVAVGELITDGYGISGGELALGRDVLVAFMPWHGYNYEDAILVSERVVREDMFTSIHIEEFMTEARDNKLGPDEITCDIPNVRPEALRHLDSSGIAKVGSKVGPGDILVGRVTPKAETQLSPEEKLLKALFGDKAREVKNASLFVHPGVHGTVTDVRVFARRSAEEQLGKHKVVQTVLAQVQRREDEERRVVSSGRDRIMRSILSGACLENDYKDPETQKVIFKKGKKIAHSRLEKLGYFTLHEIAQSEKGELGERLREVDKLVSDQIDLIETRYREQRDRIRGGDELRPGVIQMVKVYLAIKRNLSIGDKMAGRHGNKGVVAKVLPVESMPYLEDGTPIDVVLSPLGVPSRMNVGQLLETHFGWALEVIGEKTAALLNDGRDDKALRNWLLEIYRGDEDKEAQLRRFSDDELRSFAAVVAEHGLPVACPVFSGATEEEIARMLSLADLPVSGKVKLYNGETGEPFDQKVTVGYIYMMKLDHLVDDKMHARSTGPYSLVTQQPLGGKAQSGGQRLGEMEVWALEAFGAANALQEFLTVKSDDVEGRNRIYEAIVKGQDLARSGTPESFNVLIKELQSLGLDIELLETRKHPRFSRASLGFESVQDRIKITR